jgi:leucyl aminopeptidase
VRQRDPGRALEMVRATFSVDGAEERRKFVEVLATGVSAADEPFLESVLDDRSKTVRREAARVLARCAGSALRERMRQRAAGMISVEKTKGGLLRRTKVTMSVEPPKELEAAWEREGVEENAIAGNAYRPGDVIRTRKGLQVEIGNTDAEGRVILCDALAFGAESNPELMIDLATLTGAARIALGPQLPALFCRNMTLAREIVDRSLALEDPLWHMPLWADYRRGIESEIGDIVNTGRNPMGGAIAAALFLEHFVPETVDWLHLDVFGWNDAPRPGRPVGGEAQAVRTLLATLRARFAP